MIDYWIRTTEQLYPVLIALGQKLGSIQVDPETGDIRATQSGSWDYIGQIYEPTGDTTIDAEGLEIPVMAPKTNGNGEVYLHANLRSPINLRATAEAMMQPVLDDEGNVVSNGDQDIINNFALLDSFFVTDGNGNTVRPVNPARVFA